MGPRPKALSPPYLTPLRNLCPPPSNQQQTQNCLRPLWSWTVEAKCHGTLCMQRAPLRVFQAPYPVRYVPRLHRSTHCASLPPIFYLSLFEDGLLQRLTASWCGCQDGWEGRLEAGREDGLERETWDSKRLGRYGDGLSFYSRHDKGRVVSEQGKV